jgi:head-tail adaptor
MMRNAKELAGRLAQRIEVQSQLENPDGIGGKSINWQKSAIIFAEVFVFGRDKQYYQGRTVHSQRLRIRCRSEHAVDLRQRVLWQGSIFSIVQVVRDPACPAEMIIYAEQVAA